MDSTFIATNHLFNYLPFSSNAEAKQTVTSLYCDVDDYVINYSLYSNI